MIEGFLQFRLCRLYLEFVYGMQLMTATHILVERSNTGAYSIIDEFGQMRRLSLQQMVP